MASFVDTGRFILRGRPRQGAPTALFDREMRRTPGFNAAMLEAGYRNRPNDPLYAIKKFIDLWGDFDFRDYRKRTVFLVPDAEQPTDEDDDQPRRRPQVERRV